MHSQVGRASAQAEVSVLIPTRFSSHLALWLFFPLLGNNLMVHPWVLLRVPVMKAHFRFFFISSLLKTILYPGISFMNNYDLYLPEFVI